MLLNQIASWPASYVSRVVSPKLSGGRFTVVAPGVLMSPSVLAGLGDVVFAVLVPLPNRVGRGLDEVAGQRRARERVVRRLVRSDLGANVEPIRVYDLIDWAELNAQATAGQRVHVAGRLRLRDDEPGLVVMRVDEGPSVEN
jgi:hypothetical protein